METSFRLLLDVLGKKKRALAQILNITENQGALLVSRRAEETDPETCRLLFHGMNEEKQRLIDEVLKADTVFQDVFGGLGPEFERRAEAYPLLVRGLQGNIKEVMDLDVKIRLQERTNRTLSAKPVSKSKTEAPQAVKNYMLDRYKENSKTSKK
jgi:hypothetical protein